MPQVSLSFSASAFLVVGAAIIAAAAAWWYYRRTVPPVSRATRLLLASLRGIAVFLLLSLLFEPLLSLISTSLRKPVLAVVIDNSRSMAITDRIGDRSRLLKETLVRHDPRAFVSDGDVRYFTFGTTLREVPAFTPDSLRFDEDGTDITGALRGLAELRERENIGAVLLMTDGSYNLGRNPLYHAEALGVPLYTVGVGDSTEQKDVLITKLLTNEVVYSETEVPVDVTIKSSGFSNEKVELTLAEGAKVLARTHITLQEGTREYSARLSYVPEGEGVKKYALRISELEGELTNANNRRAFLVRVLKSKLRVLILAGAPSPDLSIIKQTLREEKNLDVRSLTQKTPTTFYEGGNLKSMLDSADCLVTVGFPTAATTEATMEIVRTAVVQRFVPILFVNGKMVDERKLQAMGSLLPFTSSGPSSTEQLVFPEPVPGQRHHPVLATQTDEGVESWKRLPPIFKLQTSYRVRPEATMLASVRINTVVTDEPLIAVRNLNRQKCLAVTGYGVWRWRLMAQGNAQTERLLSTFLSNSVRWLTTREDARPVRVSPTRQAFVQGEPVEFQAQVYDASARPVESAQVQVRARQDGREFDIVLRPVGNGRYEGSLEGLPRGDYTYRAVATLDGQLLGEDRGRFSVGELDLEFQDTRMNVQLLRQLAQRTGGEFYLPSEMERLRTALAGNKSFAPRVLRQTQERELWHWPVILVALTILLAAEWFVRKRNGML